MRARTSHFTHFQRHAGKFTPPKQGVVERRETESSITFSISGRTKLSSGPRCMLFRPALVLIINAWGFGSGCHFFFTPFFPYLLYASFAILLRDISRVELYAPSLCVENALHIAVNYIRAPPPRRVDWNAKVPVAFVHPIQVITKYSDWCCYTYPS